eukprot:TRINITY_DN6259_c0_g2_i1.p1 TRINITY_DN6259_c0_g2~~TRINITY_DN6259_c0_g2_i1.p1  ORF type:complete len:124 (-),score=29.35 TRINITY_DN6259_c0_g2_i1:466-816(-)
MSQHHLPMTVAAVTAVGGAVGYARTKSVPSLVAGLGFGALFGFAAYRIKQGGYVSGNEIAAVAAITLAGAMGARAAKTKAPVPTALFTVGVVSAGYHIYKLYGLSKDGFKLVPPEN